MTTDPYVCPWCDRHSAVPSLNELHMTRCEARPEETA